MKFHFSLFLFLLQPTSAWIATSIVRSSFETTSHLLSESAVSSSSSSSTTATSSLTLDLVSKLRYRELREELSQRQLPHEGTTTQLRDRLRKAAIVECNLTETGELDENCQVRRTIDLLLFRCGTRSLFSQSCSFRYIAHRHGRTAGFCRIYRHC